MTRLAARWYSAAMLRMALSGFLLMASWAGANETPSFESGPVQTGPCSSSLSHYAWHVLSFLKQNPDVDFTIGELAGRIAYRKDVSEVYAQNRLSRALKEIIDDLRIHDPDHEHLLHHPDSIRWLKEPIAVQRKMILDLGVKFRVEVSSGWAKWRHFGAVELSQGQEHLLRALMSAPGYRLDAVDVAPSATRARHSPGRHLHLARAFARNLRTRFLSVDPEFPGLKFNRSGLPLVPEELLSEIGRAENVLRLGDGSFATCGPHLVATSLDRGAH